ncbi:50S ribosomal protein L35 [bacterium]|nr:50S ribosomal protein L35 [bacterium]
MPKLKSHSGAKKRFKKTASGLIKRGKMNSKHLQLQKSNSRHRRIQQSAYIDAGNQGRIDRLIPYA